MSAQCVYQGGEGTTPPPPSLAGEGSRRLEPSEVTGPPLLCVTLSMLSPGTNCGWHLGNGTIGVRGEEGQQVLGNR